MIAIKGMEELPTDCKKCPLVGAKGSPTDPFNPMMCIAIWAITHEIKYCVCGRIRDDCPLVEIVTCKDCKHYRSKGDEYSYCTKRIPFASFTECREPNFYCADAERRECSECSQAECSHTQVMQIPTANVVEREKIDKAIEKIKGQFYVLLKDETPVEELWWNNALEKTLEILKGI